MSGGARLKLKLGVSLNNVYTDVSKANEIQLVFKLIFQDFILFDVNSVSVFVEIQRMGRQDACSYLYFEN